jgi:putative transposase
MYNSSLTDEQWQMIKRFFDRKTGKVTSGRPVETSYRLIFDAILYITVTGIQWRMLPHDFPPYGTVYYHFNKWKNNGIFKKVNDELSKYFRIMSGKNENPSLGIIDSQSSKTTENAETRGFDGNKKVKGRKRHIIVDTLGNIIDVQVHDANIHDSKGAGLFLISLKKLPYQLAKIIADKGYCGSIRNEFKNVLKIELEIAGEEKNNNRFVVVSKRWIVERTFAWLGKCRRLCRDYETLSASVASYCYLAMIKLLINRLVSNEI